MKTLKERLEQYYNRYIKDGDSDETGGCASRYNEFNEIYPDLMIAIAKANILDKQIITRLLKSQEGEEE